MLRSTGMVVSMLLLCSVSMVAESDRATEPPSVCLTPCHVCSYCWRLSMENCAALPSVSTMATTAAAL